MCVAPGEVSALHVWPPCTRLHLSGVAAAAEAAAKAARGRGAGLLSPPGWSPPLRASSALSSSSPSLGRRCGATNETEKGGFPLFFADMLRACSEKNAVRIGFLRFEH